MIRKRRDRALTGLAAVAVLIVAACGTRLDHDTIVQAAAAAAAGGAGAGPGQAGELGDNGEFGAPGEREAGEAGAKGTRPGEAGRRPGEGGSGGSRAGGDQASGDSRQASGAPIVIGSVGTYSGPVGASLQQAPRALRAWAADINSSGGIGGRPVKLIVMDDGGDSARSRSQVRELVEQHKAVAIVGAMSLSAGVRAWRDYLEEKKVPAIGGTCVEAWRGSPVMFDQCPAIVDFAYGVPAIGAKFGKGKKFGGLFCAEDPVCSFAEERWFNKGDARRAGLDPAYRARISLTQPDFTSECIQARNARVELLSVMADANTVGRVAASCRRQNFSPQFVQLGATVTAASASQTGLDDMLVSSPVFPFAGLSTPAFREFDAAWKRHGAGAKPGPAATMAWAAAKVFEKAAKEAGSKIDSNSLIAKLYSYKNERFGGLTVPMTYTAGKGTTSTPCVFVMKAQGGRWTAPQGDKPHCF